MFFLKLNEEEIPQDLGRNEAISLEKNQYSEDAPNLSADKEVNSPKEDESILMNLDDKFANDYQFNLTGIMNLSSMKLTDNDIPMIIQRAVNEKHKKSLGFIFRDNALTSEGVKTLVDTVLKMRLNVTYLSLSDNPDIGDAGVEHVARLLQKSRSINFLALPNIGMTDRGVRLLANALCGNGSSSNCAPLEKLYISFNKLITDESFEAILQILGYNQTLKIFSVQHCSFSDRVRRRLKQVGVKMKKRKFSLVE